MAAVRARSSGPCIRTDSLSLGSHRAMLVTSSQTERGQSSPAIQIFEIASLSSAIHSRSIPGLIGHLPPPSTFFLRISFPTLEFSSTSLIDTNYFTSNEILVFSCERWTNELELLSKSSRKFQPFRAFFPLASHYRTRSIDRIWTCFSSSSFPRRMLIESKIDELPLSRHVNTRARRLFASVRTSRISNFDGIIGWRFDFRRKT